MKDPEQTIPVVEPVENVTNQDLSRVPTKDSDSHALQNGDTNGVTNGSNEADDILQFEQEHSADKIEEMPELALVKEMSPETEDDILNKFDTTDALVPDSDFQKLEDTLLNDSDDFDVLTNNVNGFAEAEDNHEPVKTTLNDNTTTTIVAETTNDIDTVVDVPEIAINDLDTFKAPDDADTIADATHEDNSTSDVINTPTNEAIVQNGHEEMITEDEKCIANDETSDGDTTSKEEQDAKIKDQIMDTEDLLEIAKDAPTETELEQDPDSMDHDEESDCDKLADVDVNDEIEEEFDSQHIDQASKDESDCKDVGEVGVESEDISESDVAISNENSNSGDKEDDLVIDIKNNDLESDEKDCEVIEENSTVMEIDESSTIKDDTTDFDDTTKSTVEVPTKTSKRSLSDVEMETEPKKIKLLEEDLTDDVKTDDDVKDDDCDFKVANLEIDDLKVDDHVEDAEDKKDPKYAAIKDENVVNSFHEFMRSKYITKLTRCDLEHFCLQKMCEAIFHKSELGEIRHQLGVQEQMVEMWRKEVQQLSKQARDLDIVNKRLLHELRLKHEREKPLIPVKITRSVGLQVRSDGMVNMVTPKRRPSRPMPANVIHPLAPKPQSKPPVPPLTKPAPTAPNSPKPSKVIAPKANALLTQALVNSAASNSATNNAILSALNKSPAKSIPAPPLRVIPVKSQVQKNAAPKATAVITPTHTTKPVDKTFIDLTEEEEKRPQTVSLSTVPVTTTSVRIVKSANNVVTTNTVANPRIMYVYNNHLHQGLFSSDPSKPGTQKLMLKLNSNMMGQTNGVLTAVPNSSLAVANAGMRAGQQIRLTSPVTAVRSTITATKSVLKHPAPLPPPPVSQLSIAARKPIPPRPHLTIRRSSGGIVLSWKMPYNLDNYESIASYQLYAYQETPAVPSSEMWRKVGDVKALALPMACTLTQFADGNKYHFAVRAVDVHKRMGQFSEPEQILL